MPKPPALELMQPSAKLLVPPISKEPRRETVQETKGSGTRSQSPAPVLQDETRLENPPFRTKSFPPINSTSSLNYAKPNKPRGHIPPFFQPKQAISDASDLPRRRQPHKLAGQGKPARPKRMTPPVEPLAPMPKRIPDQSAPHQELDKLDSADFPLEIEDMTSESDPLPLHEDARIKPTRLVEKIDCR
jgi:hypothetical protein